MSTSPTAIAVTCKISLLAFLMIIFKPVIEIDGHPQDGAWSRTEIPVAAGRHSVTVFWKMYWVLPSNRAEITVDVADGATTEVTYQGRWFFFLPGKISLGQTAVGV